MLTKITTLKKIEKTGNFKVNFELLFLAFNKLKMGIIQIKSNRKKGNEPS